MSDENSITVWSKPLGGWLILIVILLAKQAWDGIYGSLLALIVNLHVFQTYGRWAMNEVIPQVGWFGNLTAIELFTTSLFALFVLKLTLTCSVRAPKWIIGYTAFNAFFSAAIVALLWASDAYHTRTYNDFLRGSIRESIENIALCAVVALYLIYSKRVRETFVRPEKTVAGAIF